MKHDSERHSELDHKKHHVADAETPHPAGEHGRAKHTHGGQHGAHNQQHGSDSRAHVDASDNAKKTMIGEKVPDFEVTINGKLWKLSELRKNAEMTKDGTLVLTFWCSFCHSCRHVEHPLNDLAKQYKNRVGVIALDASVGETTETAAKFAEKRGLTLPIALNANGTAADIFGVRATTTTVVIDSHGVLRYRGCSVTVSTPSPKTHCELCSRAMMSRRRKLPKRADRLNADTLRARLITFQTLSQF